MELKRFSASDVSYILRMSSIVQKYPFACTGITKRGEILVQAFNCI